MNMAMPGRSEPHSLQAFALRALSRCGTLDEDDYSAVRAAVMDVQCRPAGHELIAEGDPLNHSSLLLEGWAVRQRILSDGRRQICSFVLPGDGLGLCARPDGVASQPTFALTPVKVAPMPQLNLRLQHGPAGGLREVAWNMICLEETFLANQIVRLGRQSARERMIHLLLEIQDRLRANGVIDEDGILLPFTQEVLSDAVGLSTVHTNRILQKLRRERLIETRGATMRLQNSVALSKIADYRAPPWLSRILSEF